MCVFQFYLGMFTMKRCVHRFKLNIGKKAAIMVWYLPYPPRFVWPDDQWYNPKDKTLYVADMVMYCWVYLHKRIEFPEYTRVMGRR